MSTYLHDDLQQDSIILDLPSRKIVKTAIEQAREQRSARNSHLLFVAV